MGNHYVILLSLDDGPSFLWVCKCNIMAIQLIR